MDLAPDSWTAWGTIILAFATAGSTAWSARTTRTDRRRDDAKRNEDARRLDAERRMREDAEASQVDVHWTNTKITVCTPPGCTVKQAAAFRANIHGGIICVLEGTCGKPSRYDSQVANPRCMGRWQHDCMLRAPFNDNDEPMASFVDRHGNLYYWFRGAVQRFGPNDDAGSALEWFDKDIRTGPEG